MKTTPEQIAEVERLLKAVERGYYKAMDKYKAALYYIAPSLIADWKEMREEIERLNLALQQRDKCSFIGPMRDCPTHGESSEIERLTKDLDEVRERLKAQSTPAFTTHVAVCNCHLYEPGQLTGGWFCPTHGQQF